MSGRFAASLGNYSAIFGHARCCRNGMRPGFRFFSILLVSVPFVAAGCCGDDDATVDGSGATSGASQVGTGGSSAGMGGSSAGANQGGTAGSAGGVPVNAGGADACVPIGEDINGVSEPLDDACDEFHCPATVSDAAEKALDDCTNTFAPRITYGCGKVTVDYSDFSGGVAYTFDAATNQVVLIRNGSDTPFGECHVTEYVYGDPGESCPDALTCYPCDDLRNDAKGNAGAAGAAGQTGSAGDAGSPGFAGAGGAGAAAPPHCPNFSEL